MFRSGEYRPRWGWIGVFGMTGILMAIASCSPSPPAETVPRTLSSPLPPASDRTAFVGNETCGTCHPDEAKAHATTNHVQTAHFLDRRFLGKLAPPVGPIANTPFAFAAKGDRFGLVARSEPQGEPHLLELVLGSGKSGMTYVKILGESMLAEMHMSYFPKRQKWYVTPGTEKLRPENMGRMREGDEARHCIQCHTVTLPDNSLIPEQRFLGVGCESCHGPGSNHVTEAQAGKDSTRSIESLRSAGGDRINQVCGTCHRLTTVDTSTPSDTARFQPYGLAKSLCFTRSNQALTCITCHNPHSNAETDPRFYEAICLRCHTAPSPVKPLKNTSPVLKKPCPVNPKTKCISCHMPERRVFADTSIPTTMADHFIRKPDTRPKAESRRP